MRSQRESDREHGYSGSGGTDHFEATGDLAWDARSDFQDNNPKYWALEKRRRKSRLEPRQYP